MLDDLKYIHTKDSGDAFGIIAKSSDQLLGTHAVLHRPLPNSGFTNVVFSGMGGSALAAEFSKCWPGFVVPFEIIRGYTVPDYASESTLFVVASYSGNTEEALSALKEAESRKATIAVITGGGQLAEIAEAKEYSLIRLAQSRQARYGTYAVYKSILTLLDPTGLLRHKNAVGELEKAAAILDNSVKAWLPEVPAVKNPAKLLALEIIGKSPVIYSGPLLAPAAMKWKIDLNENAKSVAWRGEYPEFNHNEFMGWTSHPIDKPYEVINLLSPLEHLRIQQRIKLSEKILSGRKPAGNEVIAQGNTHLEQLLWISVFGDFVSLYTAMLNGVDPTPLKAVDQLKKELSA